MGEPAIHNESFLQWLWGTLRFDTQSLVTESGDSLLILDPGQLNTSDGPDFTQCHLSMGPMEWRGDIELHIEESAWYHHGHHRDPNYDNVVLHVFLQPGNPARRSDGTHPPRLNLSTALPPQLQQLTHTFAQPERLACHHLIQHLSEETLRTQFDRAHREYFEQKVDDLLQFYPSEFPLDAAWRQMVLTALFDGLGISRNREPMRQLLNQLSLDFSGSTRYDPEALRLRALQRSGIHAGTSQFSWKRKGCRPANRPQLRIQQGVWLIPYLLATPLRAFLDADPAAYWEEWLEQSPPSLRIGQQRSKILFGTVFLPSLYLLGALGASASLKHRSFTCWQNLTTPIPKSLLRPFQESDVAASTYQHRLGSVYQLRHYCRPHRCHDCEILKKSLRA
ncbi:MAG: DUF2851 family protein [Bacteroidota bacterium]